MHLQPRFSADDWGMTPAVNEGILELARRGALESVSLLANGASLEHGLPELLRVPGLVFSLHFNLTEGTPVSGTVATLVDARTGRFRSHPRLILACLAGRIARAQVEEEFRCQLARLRRLGVPVSRVDGHHHVHLLPSVAGAVSRAMRAHGILRLRAMTDASHWPSFLQTAVFRALRPGLRLDACHYLLPRDLRSAESFRRKLRRCAGAPLLVHPASHDDFSGYAGSDPLRAGRVAQRNALRALLDTLPGPEGGQGQGSMVF